MLLNKLEGTRNVEKKIPLNDQMCISVLTLFPVKLFSAVWFVRQSAWTTCISLNDTIPFYASVGSSRPVVSPIMTCIKIDIGDARHAEKIRFTLIPESESQQSDTVFVMHWRPSSKNKTLYIGNITNHYHIPIHFIALILKHGVKAETCS